VSRRSRVDRLENSFPDPLRFCCAMPSPEELKATFAELRHLMAADPCRSWAEARISLLPTTCTRTGGCLCGEGAAYIYQVTERVRQQESNMHDLPPDMGEEPAARP